MERLPHSQFLENAKERSSVVAYLFEDEGSDLEHRAQEIIQTIDQLLVFDEEGVLKGVLDGTYLDDTGTRRLAGNMYAQTEELSHLKFILNTTPKDLMELDDVILRDGSVLGDTIYEREEVQSLPTTEVRTTEEAIARRAILIRAACGAIIEDSAQEDSQTRSA